jgi:hypothetical protein
MSGAPSKAASGDIALRLAFEMAFERQLSCDAWPWRTVKRAGSRIEITMSGRGTIDLAGYRSGDIIGPP